MFACTLYVMVSSIDRLSCHRVLLTVDGEPSDRGMVPEALVTETEQQEAMSLESGEDVTTERKDADAAASVVLPQTLKRGVLFQEVTLRSWILQKLFTYLQCKLRRVQDRTLTLAQLQLLRANQFTQMSSRWILLRVLLQNYLQCILKLEQT